MKKLYAAPEFEMIRFESVSARTEETTYEGDVEMDDIFDLSANPDETF